MNSAHHGHACCDVQKNWIRLGCCNGARMINRHTLLASTVVLVQLVGVWQQARPEENRSLLQTVQMPAEMSEAHLRVGMNLEAPIPPLLFREE